MSTDLEKRVTTLETEIRLFMQSRDKFEAEVKGSFVEVKKTLNDLINEVRDQKTIDAVDAERARTIEQMVGNHALSIKVLEDWQKDIMSKVRLISFVGGGSAAGIATLIIAVYNYLVSKGH